MSYSITPKGNFEYILDGETHQVTPEQIGEPQKTANRQFKDDTETWEYKYEARLVEGSVVSWIVNVELGDSLFHDTSSSGVRGVPSGVEVASDPDFLSVPDEDEAH